MSIQGTHKSSTAQASPPGLFQLQVEYFTDPLCCWSWALEPQCRRLRYEFASLITWKNRMGGLLSGWGNFRDSLLTVDRPVQMGAIWKEAGEASGMPVDERIWVEQPPASSFPACFAVKTAEMQGTEAGELYLRKVREAVMLHREDVSKPAPLLQVAREVADLHPDVLDDELFRYHFSEKEALPHFQQDLDETRLKGIERFPTLIITNKDRGGLILTGYRPYEVILKALMEYFPGLPDRRQTAGEGFTPYRNYPLYPRETREMELSLSSLSKPIKNSMS